MFNHFKECFLTNYYDRENIIIKNENISLQISTLEEQKNSLNANTSTIDIGECENILKTIYNISKDDSLIIVKIDKKTEDLFSTYVKYEIYHPYNLSQLDLNFCKKITIIINIPINLYSDTVSLYDSLIELGYNLYDTEDDDYNDICSTYTSVNGTFMTFKDWKKKMYNISGNITICQRGCIFKSYNKTTKKAKCDCLVLNITTEANVTYININKDNIGNNVLSTLNNSNFLVLKCYILFLSKFFKNKGRIILLLILLFFFILLFIYYNKGRKNMNSDMQLILSRKIYVYNKYKIKNIKNKKKRKIFKDKGNRQNTINKK